MKSNVPAVSSHKGRGRPPMANRDEIKIEFCERVTGGESARTICSDEHMPASAVIYRWLAKDEEFSEQYARATELRGWNFGERVTDLAERLLEDKDLDPNRVRVAVDALKWAAARLAPKRYGDRLETRHTGDVTATLVPIRLKGD